MIDTESGEISEQKIEGFIEIPYLKKMRDDAADWKDTQKSGTFSHPSTGLAKIREQAAGAVRNQIHALALQYNAIPVYEDEVDAFETGGQRISKLYKTLKTSDVMTGKSNAADDGVRSHFWGTKYMAVGSVIGASMTSQTCRKCGVCANYEVSQVFQENEKVEVKNGKISTNFGDVLCNLDDGVYSEKSDKKKIREKIKSAQRTESAEEKKSRESGKAKRGTIEQFHCQMSECQNSTDCDAQAAHNIALKYYLKLVAENENNGEDFKKEEYQTEKGRFSSLKYFMDKGKEY
ncbi:TPA: hypothetical protein EYP45_03410 [Candidatus Peregrinibacteria bacterium]|nr:hypothetical protein [Candidatus Peregrinibacteria bacterium]